MLKFQKVGHLWMMTFVCKWVMWPELSAVLIPMVFEALALGLCVKDNSQSVFIILLYWSLDTEALPGFHL